MKEFYYHGNVTKSKDRQALFSMRRRIGRPYKVNDHELRREITE